MQVVPTKKQGNRSYYNETSVQKGDFWPETDWFARHSKSQSQVAFSKKVIPLEESRFDLMP